MVCFMGPQRVAHGSVTGMKCVSDPFVCLFVVFVVENIIGII